MEATAPDSLLPARLGPAEKRALDLLSDWPWATRQELAGLMGVSVRRVSQVAAGLQEYGLVNRQRHPSGGLRRRMQRVLGVEDFHELFELEHPSQES